MRKVTVFALSTCLLFGCYLLFGSGNVSEAGKGKEHEIVHTVFVSLKDNSPTERDKIVTLCKKYLAKHPGEVYFRVGPKSDSGPTKETAERENFDVGWVNVFADAAALTKYQESEELKTFRKLSEPQIKHMKVFDLANHK